MNATFTRRMFAVTGLAAIGGALYSLLPFTRRSKSSTSEVPHILDESPTTTGPGQLVDEITPSAKVLSSEQEEVRDWYRKEFDIEPVYGPDGEITKFVSTNELWNSDGQPVEYDTGFVRDAVSQLSESGDVEHLPIPAGVEGAGQHTTPLGIGAPTEPVETTLH